MSSTIPEYLTCPISLKLFKDPVSVPCCGHTFSRSSLINLKNTTSTLTCPMCRANLNDFDITNAAKNIAIHNMVDIYKGNQQDPVNNLSHQWSATVNPVVDGNGNQLQMNQLELNIEKSNFSIRPSLLIIAADRSGSMMGNPWKQVEKALLYIYEMSQQNPMIKIRIIGYDHSAATIPLTGIKNHDINLIKTMFTSGGTNFQAAFTEIRNNLRKFMSSSDPADELKDNNVSSASVVFLTDGCDGYMTTEAIQNEKLSEFRNQLETEWGWGGPLTIHSVGFGQYCSRNFLEQLWKLGNINGTFRYADPQDDGDTLCTKLQGIFEVVSKSVSIPMSLCFKSKRYQLLDYSSNNGGGSKDEETQDETQDAQETNFNVTFQVNKSHRGSFKCWVVDTGIVDDVGNDNSVGTIAINNVIDKDTIVPLAISKPKSTHKNKSLFDSWLLYLVDKLAVSLIDLIQKKTTIAEPMRQLHCSVMREKVNRIRMATSSTSILSKMKFIDQQIEAFSSGFEIDLNKLSDLRFGSIYGAIESNMTSGSVSSSRPQNQGSYIVQTNTLPTIKDVTYVERRVRYSQNNTGKNRNPLQQKITMEYNREATEEMKSLIDQASISDLLYTDNDKNNCIHLMAYCGLSHLLKYTLEKMKSRNEITSEIINLENKDGESALTLCIKKRGFHRIMNMLFLCGAKIPGKKKKALSKYAIDEGYIQTADIIRSMGEDPTEINETMSVAFIQFQYDKIMAAGLKFKVDNYLQVCLSKGMYELSNELIQKHEAKPTLKMLYDYCYPRKPDAADTEDYLKLAKLLINANPDLLNQTDENQETPLFKACEKGSKPHVVYFIEQGAEIDKPNVLGNTPLWISCAKGYPCIVEELLNHNADVNHANLKGNVPMYSLCTKGPHKLVELLIIFEADLEHLNANKDSLVLISCRSGQHEILKTLLNHVSPEFVDFKAQIDGFNAIMSSAEANKPECIRVLNEYGVDLNQITDDNSPVLHKATPLHIAAYYNCVEAAQTLISLGADVNKGDKNGHTPLHMAIIQGNIEVIKLLRSCKRVDIRKQDKMGLTPVAYCASKPSIRKLLVNPMLDILVSLVHGKFGRSDELEAIKLLKQSQMEFQNICPEESIFDVLLNDGTSILTLAVIYNKVQLVELFSQHLDCDPLSVNMYGVNTLMWAYLKKNHRVMTLLPLDENTTQIVNEMKARIEKVVGKNVQNRMLLMSGHAPKPDKILCGSSSGIFARMTSYINILTSNYKYKFQNFSKDILQLIEDDASSTALTVTSSFSKPNLIDLDEEFLNALLWNTKIYMINRYMSPSVYCDLKPQELLAINLFTSHEKISNVINNAIINRNDQVKAVMRPIVNILYQTINKLPPYQGEVYVGTTELDRTLFTVGKEVSWMTFLSGSSIWRTAVENTPEFSTKKRQGTVLVIKSKTSGRFVGNYSQFTFDGEVIVPPNSKFVVTKWYMGDVIALGQGNIRDHTFKTTEEERLEFSTNKKSLIIQLEEV